MSRPLMIALMLAASLGAPALAATPPKQPEKGPGGTDYVASQVIKRGVGTASSGTYVFHAAGPAKAPRPVVVLFHSWGAANPGTYGGWIEHLARRGNLVLFPRFQEVNRSRPQDATALAGQLVKQALADLADDPDARPDPKRVAYLGHVAGAAIALNLAGAEGLPEPKLIFAAMPGGITTEEKGRGIYLADLATVPASTLLVTINGDRDHLPIDRHVRRVLKETTAVPPNRKLYMRVASDDHGFPTTNATPASPGSPKAEYDAAAIKLPPDPPKDPKQKNTWRWSADMALSGEQTILAAQLAANGTDTLDYLAYWKTFDLALDAALSGKDAAFLRADPRLVDMGTWSDGWPVRRLTAEIPKAETPKAGEAPKVEANGRPRVN